MGLEIVALIKWQAVGAWCLMIIVATLKNTFLRKLIWSKIPDWLKATVAPALSIIAFALAEGDKFNVGTFWIAITTGVAAVYLHELLDGLKTAPFIGDKWRRIIDEVGKSLGKPETVKKESVDNKSEGV